MSSRAVVLEDLERQDRISADDVRLARSVLFDDVLIEPEEAEALFRINEAAKATCPEWRMLFVEALTDYVVRQQTPTGYIDQAKADWLTARIAADGRIKTGTELELLTYVLEQAVRAPASLSSFALRSCAEAALTPERRAGDGPTLTAEEVARLSRVLYAFASDGGGASVSRDEAEVLFALNDAARGRPNDPSWRDLFAHAIGGSIMMAAGYGGLEPAEALRLDAWLKAPTPGVARILINTVARLAGVGSQSEPMKNDDEIYLADLAADEAAARAAAPVDAAEASWLISRIGRDGTLDDNERALLLFVQAEASALAPELKTLIDMAAEPTPVPAKAFGRRA